MTHDGRRFTSILFVVFGPLFVLGGYAAAFTTEGAVLVYCGLAMLATGLLLRTPLPAPAAFLGGIVALGVMIGTML